MAYKVLHKNEMTELEKLLKDGWKEVMRFSNQHGDYIILQKKTAP